jgi:predicted nucleic acid-binding protein
MGCIANLKPPPGPSGGAVPREIGTFDTMIAAHASATSTIIVTNNVEHFSRVSGLRLENWTTDT